MSSTPAAFEGIVYPLSYEFSSDVAPFVSTLNDSYYKDDHYRSAYVTENSVVTNMKAEPDNFSQFMKKLQSMPSVTEIDFYIDGFIALFGNKNDVELKSLIEDFKGTKIQSIRLRVFSTRSKDALNILLLKLKNILSTTDFLGTFDFTLVLNLDSNSEEELAKPITALSELLEVHRNIRNLDISLSNSTALTYLASALQKSSVASLTIDGTHSYDEASKMGTFSLSILENFLKQLSKTNLKELRLPQQKLGALAWELPKLLNLLNASKIISLDLSQNEISAIDSAPELDKKHSNDIPANRIARKYDKFISQFSKALQNFEQIDLSGNFNGTSDVNRDLYILIEIAKHFKNYGRLTALKLNNSPLCSFIGNEMIPFLTVISSIPTLVVFEMAGNNLYFCDHSIMSMDAQGRNIPDISKEDKIKAFCTIINRSNIQVLNLEQSRFTNETLELLSKYLADNKQLREIRLLEISFSEFNRLNIPTTLTQMLENNKRSKSLIAASSTSDNSSKISNSTIPSSGCNTASGDHYSDSDKGDRKTAVESQNNPKSPENSNVLNVVGNATHNSPTPVTFQYSNQMEREKSETTTPPPEPKNTSNQKECVKGGTYVLRLNQDVMDLDKKRMNDTSGDLDVYFAHEDGRKETLMSLPITLRYRDEFVAMTTAAPETTSAEPYPKVSQPIRVTARYDNGVWVRGAMKTTGNLEIRFKQGDAKIRNCWVLVSSKNSGDTDINDTVLIDLPVPKNLELRGHFGCRFNISEFRCPSVSIDVPMTRVEDVNDLEKRPVFANN